jgi:peptidoglycan hydrolase-like protein with peptidoglycan-binding domain
MRTYSRAKTFAQHQHDRPRAAGWFNQCQAFSRQCVGAPPFGTSARLAFNAIPAAHRHTSSPPPAGSIAYYGRSDRGFGHAVFVIEGGFVWSNDILRRGKIDRVKWNIFVPRWGLAYRGWIDWCPSGPLPVPRPTKSRVGFRQGKKVYRSKMRFRQPDSDSVWNLQVALMAKAFKFADGPTGYYGTHTRAACAAFQRRQGWSGRNADGIAGPQTIRRLGLIWVDR